MNATLFLVCIKTVLHISCHRIADMDTICKPNEDSECPCYSLQKERLIHFNAVIRGCIKHKQCNQQWYQDERIIRSLHMLVLNLMHIDTVMVATGTVEEVSRLAGEAACGTPTVCAWRWTGQTHTPPPVLIGALRTMSATLMSETGKKEKKKILSAQVKKLPNSILISLLKPVSTSNIN